MEKADKESIRKHNIALVLNLLRCSDLSRSDLAERSGLSHSTVGALVAKLIEDGLLFEKETAESSGGRKPVILSLNPQAAYALLVRIQPYALEFAIADLAMRVVERRRVAYEELNQAGMDAVLRAGLERMLDDSPAVRPRIRGCGISIPGMVAHPSNLILYAAKLGLRDYDICATVRRVFAGDVFVFKDTDAMLLGERLTGDFLRSGNCLYFWVDSGVGLSYLHHGELLQLGHSGMEIGHVVLDERGPACACGKRGCVESYVGETAALQDYRLLSQPGAPVPRSYGEIVRMANEGIAPCDGIIAGQCDRLGSAVAAAVNLFAPDEVLIGGVLADAAPRYRDRVRKAAGEAMLSVFSGVRFGFTHTAEKSGLTGMANYVLENTFFQKM